MKLKVALIISYSGKNYSGLQHNSTGNTIEDYILKVLTKLKYITAMNAAEPQKTGLQRCCRTDKGVHAIMNVLVIKVLKEVNIEEVNRELKESVVLLKVVRVSKSFVAKNRCDRRVYEYFIPKDVFFNEDSNKDSNLNKDSNINKDSNLNKDTNIEKDENLEISNNLEKFNNFIKNYVGTKNFHNFTTRSFEKGKTRNIIEIKTISHKNFIIFRIKGQSFMLHQIRKMVGLALLVIRKNFDALKVLNKVFSEEVFNVPKAPSQFLLLERPEFDYYNSKNVDKAIDVCEDVIEERRGVIYGEVEEEVKEGHFKAWFDTIDEHFYDFEHFYN